MWNTPRSYLDVFNAWAGICLLGLTFILGSCQPIPKTPLPPSTLKSTYQETQYKVSTSNPIPRLESPTASQTTLPTATKTPVASRVRLPTINPIAVFSESMSIGMSAGGKPIIVYRFGTGPRRRLIIAGIHGGFEWNTIKLANQLIDYTIQNPELIPADITLYILPSLNPDGEARGHGPLARSNDHNVDLNRNFSTNWQPDWPRTGCWQMEQISAGESPLSEPESSALTHFLLTQPIDALISYHSAGLGIYPGENPANSISQKLASTLASVSIYSYPPFDTGCLHTGTLVDYAAGIGIAAVDVELTTRWDPEFEVNLKILGALLSWNRGIEPNLLPLPEN